MTEFILTPKTKHLNASVIKDLITIRQDMARVRFLQERFPGTIFLEKLAKDVGVNLVGKGYNQLPEAPKGTKAI